MSIIIIIVVVIAYRLTHPLFNHSRTNYSGCCFPTLENCAIVNYCNSVPASAAKQGYRQVATGSERRIVCDPSNRETMSKVNICA